jgi:hypothetical protein
VERLWNLCSFTVFTLLPRRTAANSLAVLLNKHTYTTTFRRPITWPPRKAAANSLLDVLLHKHICATTIYCPITCPLRKALANSLDVLLYKHTYTTTIHCSITGRRQSRSQLPPIAAATFTNTAAKHFSTSHYQ